MAILTTDELRIQFWQAIREAAPEQWRALADGGPAGVEVWLHENHLTYQGQPAAWCRVLAGRHLDLWRDHAATMARISSSGVERNITPLSPLIHVLPAPDTSPESAPDNLGLYPLSLPGVPVARPISRDACRFKLATWGWRPDLMAGEAFGALADEPAAFVGESRQEARERLEGIFRAKLEAHLDAVGALWEETGAQEKRKLDHLLWLAEWQVAERNAAYIFRTHLGPHAPRVRRGTRMVVSYERIHKALRETAARLELDLRKGR